MKPSSLLLIFLVVPITLFSQSLTAIDRYLRIDASSHDPIYTTYSATISRTTFPEAIAYKMDYYTDSSPVTFTGNKSGKMYSFWKIDDTLVMKTGEYYKKPVVIYSFPDMMVMEYQPVKEIHVRETFFVYSFSMALVDMEITNTGALGHDVSVFPVLDFGNDSAEVSRFDNPTSGFLAERLVRHNELTTSRSNEIQRPENFTEFFTASPKISGFDYGLSSPGDSRLLQMDGTSSRPIIDSIKPTDTFARFLMFHKARFVRPNETISFRYIRGVRRKDEKTESLVSEAGKLKSCLMKTFFEDNLMLFANVPKTMFDRPQDKMIYISALNLSRVSMFPAFAPFVYNFFSSVKNQLPDSLKYRQLWKDAPGLMGYIYVDRNSADNAFRLLTDYLDQKKPLTFSVTEAGKGKISSAIPVYNLIGLQLYKQSGDKKFLRETYVTGVKFVNLLIRNNDPGSEMNYAIAALLSAEENCLSWMAKELGRTAESLEWSKKAQAVSPVKEGNMNQLPDSSLILNYLNYYCMKNSGSPDEAAELAGKIISCVSAQLSKTHDFYEFYNLQDDSGYGITNYFPDSIIAKLLIEENVK